MSSDIHSVDRQHAEVTLFLRRGSVGAGEFIGRDDPDRDRVDGFDEMGQASREEASFAGVHENPRRE